jgi:multidrug transporter EmrE-like cation transporter
MTIEFRGLVLVLALSFVGVAADAVLKTASLHRSPFTTAAFAAGCVLSIVFAVIWVHLMHTMKMATAGILYAVMSTLLLVFVGVTFFGERLSPGELTGIGMALGALVLLHGAAE